MLVSGQAQVQMDWPLIEYQVFPPRVVELETKKGVQFKVYGQRIKLYFGHAESVNEVIEAYHHDEG